MPRGDGTYRSQMVGSARWLSLHLRTKGAMRERMEEYALSLHPDKTRLIEFGRFAAEQRVRRGLGKLETFKFLGFTLICGRSRRGRFVLKRKSRSDRMRAKLKEIATAQAPACP